MVSYNVAQCFVILIICLSVEYSFGQFPHNLHIPGMAGHIVNPFSNDFKMPELPKYDYPSINIVQPDINKIREEVLREYEEGLKKKKLKDRFGIEEISDLPCDIHDVLEYYFQIKSKVCSAVNKPLSNAEREEIDLLMSLENDIHTFRSKASHQALQANCNLLAKMRKKYSSLVGDLTKMNEASMKDMEEEIMDWLGTKPKKKRPSVPSTAIASLNSRPFSGFKFKVLNLLRELMDEFTRCTGLHLPNVQMKNLDHMFKSQLEKLKNFQF